MPHVSHFESDFLFTKQILDRKCKNMTIHNKNKINLKNKILYCNIICKNNIPKINYITDRKFS